MRLAFLVFTFAASCIVAHAQKIIGPELEQIPPATTAFHATAISKMDTSVRTWVTALAYAAANSTDPVARTESALRHSITQRFKGQAIQPEGIEALLAVAFAEKIKALKQKIDEINSQIAVLNALRDQLEALRKELASARDEARGMRATDLCATVGCTRANARVDTVLAARTKARIEGFSVRKANTIGELRMYVDRTRDLRDSVSELSEEQQLKMQLLVERHAKAASVLSSIMKKTSETSHAIIANLK